MHTFKAFFQLIVIGTIISCAFASLKSSEEKKNRHARSILFENRWPDPDPNIIRFPHQASCHYYYLVLSDEDITIKKCPYGELFDYFIHNCVKKELARCWSQHFGNMNHKHIHLHKKRRQFRCPYPWGKYPDIYDCSKYYQCLNGNVKHKKCAPYEYFDKIAGKCVAEIKAICADETDVVEHGYKCPRSWGLFSFHKDCSKYYECLQRNPILRTCQKNTLFDQKKRKCVSKNHVVCASRHNPYEKIVHSSTPTEESSVETTTIHDQQNPSEETISDVKKVSFKPETSTYSDAKSSLIDTSTSEEEANIVTRNISVTSMSSYNNTENSISTSQDEANMKTENISFTTVSSYNNVQNSMSTSKDAANVKTEKISVTSVSSYNNALNSTSASEERPHETTENISVANFFLQ